MAEYIEKETAMAEYIEKETAIAIIMSEPPDAHYPHWYADKIKAIPAADVAPVVHGRWVTQDETRTKFMCSLCESKNYGGHEKFCPNCGAKIDLE